jgi:8-oxo-dGTP pyrophosphatase MutT (NUDIX family)
MSRPGGADAASELPPELPIKPAATVMLVRDAPAGLEAFVLRRVAAMAFAPGMTVFPGGSVDPADHDPALEWTGPDVEWWAQHLQQSAAAARALVVAAVRELFEETGVLLAGPADPINAAAASSLDDTVRLALIEHRMTLAAALSDAGLRLRADLLRPWANWITPPGRTRRYDTFFFAAALPPGQQAEMLTTEADLGQWRSPQELFDERAAGTTALMPPTVAMLTDLAGYRTVAEVLAAQRVVTPVRVRAGDFPGVG